jgi:adenylyltransferase/sulfurtransferase
VAEPAPPAPPPPAADDRFSRQTRFAPFGAKGQERTVTATVAVVGLGGLGSWIAEHLARAGVGTLRLIDRDLVETSNLPRQGLYGDEDARHGRPKAEAAALRLSAVTGGARLEPQVAELGAGNVDRLLRGADLVMDGLDHFAGRFLLNDWCRRERVPWIYGGAVGGVGAALRIDGDRGPCLRCLFPGADRTAGGETCDTVGVLSPLPALVAAIQCSEALRLLAGDLRPGRLWQIEPWDGRVIALDPGPVSPDCVVCRREEFPALRAGRDEGDARLCGRDTVQITSPGSPEIDLAAVADRWAGLGAVERGRFLVRIHRQGLVLSLFRDGRALVQGTSSTATARALYERLVGR